MVTGLTDGCVVDVVVSSNHAEVEWGQVHLVLHSNALEEREKEREGEREGERRKGGRREEGRKRGS